MSFDPNACPDKQALSDLLLGNLPVEAGDRLLQHLMNCPRCEAFARDLGERSGVQFPTLRGSSPEDADFEADNDLPVTERIKPYRSATRTHRRQRIDSADQPFRLEGYELIEELGRGGMGVVFHAIQKKLNRPVAIKMILNGTLATPEDQVRFRIEGETLAGFSHPNFVHIYDMGAVDLVAGRQPYLVLEYVEGGNLHDWMAEQELSIREAVTLVCVLAQAMEVAHAEGIVHRDLKPGNILFARETRIRSKSRSGDSGISALGPWVELRAADGTTHVIVPKITDFGLAKHLRATKSLTKTGRPMGTPSYMAPEQAVMSPGTMGPPTDVYALGAILFECLTGRPPLLASSVTQKVARAVHDMPDPPSSIRPEIPRELDVIVMKCLEKERSLRYESAGPLADDLAAWLKSGVIRTPPTPSLSKPRSVIRRTLWPISTLVVLALLAGTLGFLFWSGGLAALLQNAARQLPQKDPRKKENLAIQKIQLQDGKKAGTFLKDLEPSAQVNWPFEPGITGKKGKDKFGPKDGKFGPKDKDFDDPAGKNMPKFFRDDVRVQGVPFPRGIFMHPPGDDVASISYRLGRRFTTFQATATLNDGPERSESPATFAVYGDGKLLWESNPPVQTQEDVRECKALDLRNVDVLKLEVRCHGGARGAHMVWLDPYVE